MATYYGKLNPRVKRLWLRALRSGRYRKATVWLCRRPTKTQPDYGFCCLGVLVDVAVLDGADVEWVAPGSPAYDRRGMRAVSTASPGDWNSSLTPNVVIAWANLDRAAQKVLTRLNDHGRSHLQIADWIEKNL